MHITYSLEDAILILLVMKIYRIPMCVTDVCLSLAEAVSVMSCSGNKAAWDIQRHHKAFIVAEYVLALTHSSLYIFPIVQRLWLPLSPPLLSLCPLGDLH